MNFLLRIVITAVVAFALSYILPGIRIESFWIAIKFSLVLAILNFLLKPILVILTLPITLITFGLFLFVINAIIVWFVGNLINGFHIENFIWALLFSLLLSLLTSILYKEQDKDAQ
ncbi:MAG TPA: phage holin family protein [Puia sp.]|jgi:putative membrane protein|nr:phage holin family protein [Puia sp.]